MVKHILKILRCENRRIFKVCLVILQRLCMKGLTAAHIGKFPFLYPLEMSDNLWYSSVEMEHWREIH